MPPTPNDEPSAEPQHTPSQRPVLRALQRWWPTLLLVAGAIVGLVSTLKRYHGDLPVYVRGATRMLAGEEVYVVEQSGFTYPPLMAVPFTPLTGLPDVGVRLVWYLVNLLLLAGVVRLLARLTGPFVAPERRRLFWVLVVLVTARHVTASFENQSNDLLILFAVTASTAAAASRREWLSGALAGLGTALKATPLLFLPIYVWQRRITAAVSLLVATLLLSLVPDLLFPRADGGRWIVTWYETFASKTGAGAPAEAEGGWVAWNVLNQSLSGTLFRLSDTGHGRETTWDVSLWQPDAETLRWATIAAQLGVVGLIALGTWRPRGWAARIDEHEGSGAESPAPTLAPIAPPSAPTATPSVRAEYGLSVLGDSALVVCGMVLLSPMSSKAHFGVLLLPVAHQLAHLFDRRRAGRRLDAVVVVCLTGVFALGSLTSKGLLGTDLGNGFLARGSVTWCALLAMLGSSWVNLRRKRL